MTGHLFARKGVASLAAIVIIICGLLTHAPGAIAQRQTAVEYYYGAWDAYFVTSFPDEIAALDGGAFGGAWKRTGQTFTVWTGPTSGALPTCRFFSVIFAPRSSHFYTDRSDECASLKQNPGWQYEGIAFYLQPLTAAYDCPPGNVILYRLYNNGMGGAPNHRFLTDPALVPPMIAAGWSLEGDGPKIAFACAPLPPPLVFKKGPSGFVTPTPSTFIVSVATARLTRPDVDDIVIGGGVAVILAPQRDGTLVNISEATFKPTPPDLVSAGAVFGDFNGDGRLDIFFGAYGDDNADFPGAMNRLLLSQPDGTYRDASALLPAVADTTGSAAVGDVNGDGYLDIYVDNLGFDSNMVGPYFLLGTGGTFTRTSTNLPESVSVVSSQTRYPAAALVDVDNDGHLDLILGNNGRGPSVILLNDGGGDFTKRPPIALPPGLFDTETRNTKNLSIVAIDLNGDGFPDLVVSQTQVDPPYSGHAIQALINDGHGGFTDQTSAYIVNAVDPAHNWIGTLAVADLNGDGIPDIYVEGIILHRDHSHPPTDPPIFAWVSDGLGHWLPMTPLDVDPTWDPDPPINYLFTDIDGDGLPDLIYLTSYDDTDPLFGEIAYQVYFNVTPKPTPSDRPQ